MGLSFMLILPFCLKVNLSVALARLFFVFSDFFVTAKAFVSWVSERLMEGRPDW
jgi:hypothetical protein